MLYLRSLKRIIHHILDFCVPQKRQITHNHHSRASKTSSKLRQVPHNRKNNGSPRLSKYLQGTNFSNNFAMSLVYISKFYIIKTLETHLLSKEIILRYLALELTFQHHFHRTSDSTHLRKIMNLARVLKYQKRATVWAPYFIISASENPTK